MDSIPQNEEAPVREINGSTDTRQVFANAWKETKAHGGFSDVLVVDVDAHCYETDSWDELIEYIPDEVIQFNAASFKDNRGRPASGIIQTAGYPNYQRANGRITYGRSYPEEGESVTLARARAGMDAMGIDYSVVFPTPLLSLGMHRQTTVETNIALAYNQWMIERVCAEEKRVKSLVYLPFNDPEACERVIETQTDHEGVCGAMITSVRHKPVHHNSYMRLYAMLEERGLPLMFHAGPHWEESGYVAQLNQFIGAHAISFVLCNMVHLTNWVLNGLPERFPKLKVGWIESGISWIGFMATRLDSEYMMRTSEAPLLKKLPSEYMRDMFYSTQPMERSNMKLLEANFDLIDARNSILYASDWPHWDFDMPGTIWDLPFLDEQAKRNILGLNSAKLFGIDPKPLKATVPAVAE
jgi:hypothetical protein